MAMASWLTSSVKNGTGNKVISLTASKNSGAQRTTIVTVTSEGVINTVNCIQLEADKFTVRVSSLTVNSSETTITNVGDCSIGSSPTANIKLETYYRDTSITVSAKAAPTGYSFIGWYEGSNLISTSLSFNFTLTSNRILVAKYKIKTYIISATSNDINQGTVDPAEQTIEYGTTATVNAIRKIGYALDGWYNGSTKISSELSYLFTVTNNISLTAKWKIYNVSTTIKVNPTGSGTVTPNPLSGQEGAMKSVEAIPASGYSFLKWVCDGKESTTNPTEFALYNNRAITAYFATSVYTVQITAGENGQVEGDNGLIGHGTQITITAIPNEGYKFVEWSNGVTDNPYSFVVTSNISLSAKFAKENYTLTANANGGTIPTTTGWAGSGETVTKQLTFDQTLGTLPIPTRTNTSSNSYNFIGWYTDPSSGTKVSNTTLMGSSNRTIYAHWSSDSRLYTVNYNTTYGTLSKTSESVYFNAKGSCTLTMPANTAQYSYTFKGWFTNPNGQGSKIGSSLTLETPVITKDVTFYAYVVRNINSYTLTVNANTGGTVTGGGTYSYGTAVTINAVADSGYNFVKWSDGNTNAERSITVTQNETYTAEFAKDSYLNLSSTAVTFDAEGGSQIVNVESNVSWTIS